MSVLVESPSRKAPIPPFEPSAAIRIVALAAAVFFLSLPALAADSASMGKDSEGGAVTEQVGEEASAPAEKPSDAAAPEGGRAQAPAAPPPVPLRLFGTVEFRTPIKGLPKWERVRSAESGNPSFTAKGIETPNAKVLQRWTKLKEQFQNAPLREKMKAVNNFFNQWPYKFDMDLWGVEDYWATPREFVMKSGDCEDYAIAKYYALRDLGVPAGSMRIAAVKDNIRGLGHAILVVFVDNDAYILDNLTNLVLSHKRLSHYAPQYTVNEEYLWRHVKPKSTPGKQ